MYFHFKYPVGNHGKFYIRVAKLARIIFAFFVTQSTTNISLTTQMGTVVSVIKQS